MGESLVYGIKVALAIAIATTFASAIIVLVNLLSSLVLHSVVGEVLGLMSVFLPFTPLPVFGALTLSMGAILSFLVAKKIYSLCSDFLLGTA